LSLPFITKVKRIVPYIWPHLSALIVPQGVGYNCWERNYKSMKD
jgi:hypothetical protein